MSRCPPIPLSELRGEQKELYDDLLAFADHAHGDQGFTYKRASDGALVGPFASFLSTPPALSRGFRQFGGAIGSIPGLSPSARETAILATGTHFGAAYEVYAHAAIAAANGLLSDAQIADIKAGKRPAEGGEDVQVAWEVARALCEVKGPLSGDLWKRATTCLGKDGTMALIQYVGMYSYVSVLLNGLDVPVPDE